MFLEDEQVEDEQRGQSWRRNEYENKEATMSLQLTKTPEIHFFAHLKVETSCEWKSLVPKVTETFLLQ